MTSERYSILLPLLPVRPLPRLRDSESYTLALENDSKPNDDFVYIFWICDYRKSASINLSQIEMNHQKNQMRDRSSYCPCIHFYILAVVYVDSKYRLISIFYMYDVLTIFYLLDWPYPISLDIYGPWIPLYSLSNQLKCGIDKQKLDTRKPIHIDWNFIEMEKI